MPPIKSLINATDEEIKWANEKVTFTVTCTMKRRWAAQLKGMLEYMQYLGSVGSSREVAIFSDGDGDFRPKFDIGGLDDVEAAKPVNDRDGNHGYDAG